MSASFAYDGVGRRHARTIGSTTTQFLYDELNPVQELAAGTPTVNLLTGLGIDEYFTRTDAAGARHFLTDALGSSIALTDRAGSVQTEYTYEPFGSVTSSGAGSGNTFGFTGRENDETGLNHYRARYYDPRLQRFVSEDPVGFDGGDLNLHVYVRNEPISRTDPTGKQYVDLNVTFVGPKFRGGTGGVMTNGCGANFPYLGGTVGTPGFGASASGSIAEAGPGLNESLQAAILTGVLSTFNVQIGKTYGGTWLWEFGRGIVTLGVSASAYYAWTGSGGNCVPVPSAPPGEPTASAGGSQKGGAASGGATRPKKPPMARKKN